MDDNGQEFAVNGNIKDQWSDYRVMLVKCQWQFDNGEPEKCEDADRKLQENITIMHNEGVVQSDIRDKETLKDCSNDERYDKYRGYIDRHLNDREDTENGGCCAIL